MCVRPIGWGLAVPGMALVMPMVLLTFWGYLIWRDATQSPWIVVDHAASDGTEFLPSGLTHDVVIVSDGPLPADRNASFSHMPNCQFTFERNSEKGFGGVGGGGKGPIRVSIAEILRSETFAEPSRGRTDLPWAPWPMWGWDSLHADLIDAAYNGDLIVFSTTHCLPWRIEAQSAG